MPPTTSRLEQNGHVQLDSLTHLISTHTLELRRLSSPSATEHHAAESRTRRGRARVGLQNHWDSQHCRPRRRGLPHRAQVTVAAGEVLAGLGLLEPGPERGRSQQRPLLVVVLHDEYTAGAQ